jgi:hypothetical protein
MLGDARLTGAREVSIGQEDDTELILVVLHFIQDILQRDTSTPARWSIGSMVTGAGGSGIFARLPNTLIAKT